MVYKPLCHAQNVFWGLTFFILVFYILGLILIIQLFHSHLLDMRWLKLIRRYVPHWLSGISYQKCARGIMVNYPHFDCFQQKSHHRLPPDYTAVSTKVVPQAIKRAPHSRLLDWRLQCLSWRKGKVEYTYMFALFSYIRAETPCNFNKGALNHYP